MSRRTARAGEGRPAPGPLGRLRPTPGRWAAVVLAAAVVAALCWFVGVPPTRAWALCAVGGLLVVVARVEDSAEDRWPDAQAPRTRPGRQELALTARQLEGARSDPGDRDLVAERLRRLERSRGTADHPDLDDLLSRARDAAGLRRPPTPPARRT